MRLMILVALMGCGSSEPACVIDIQIDGGLSSENGCSLCPGTTVGDSCITGGDTLACVDRGHCDYVLGE